MAISETERCNHDELFPGRVSTLTVGVTPVEVKEIVGQAEAYVGMTGALGFVHLTSDVLAERGVELPLPGQSTTTPETRCAARLAVQGEVIGADRIARTAAAAPADTAHLQHLLSVLCSSATRARSSRSPSSPPARRRRRGSQLRVLPPS